MRTFILLAALGGATVALRVGSPEPFVQAGPAAAQDGDFQWRGRLDAGKTLEIYGVKGDIRAEPASGTEVEVRAAKRARRSDPEEVAIEVVPHDDGVTICAVYPTPRRSRRPNECRPGGAHSSTDNNDVEVSWTIRLPAGVKFDGHTVNGDVVVANLASDVSAGTVNGDVEVSTSGVAEASTVNGSVRATMGRADWTGTMKFSTVNGGITVEVPSDLSADIEAATVNGAIETDFPITVRGRFMNRRMSGRVGDGGRTLEMETVNGSIRLRIAG
jgi:hypothetical protein